MQKSDFVYANALNEVPAFVFDEAVANVFADMLKRSVPGYQSALGLLGVLAQKTVTAESHVYDLGCSLGAASAMIQSRAPFQDAKIFAIDNSSAMIERAEKNFSRSQLPTVEFVCQDIKNTELSNASLVCLNLTLQFLPPASRLSLLEKVFEALSPNGSLFLFEKICFSDPEENELMNNLYYQYKGANGYSDLEISQKRTALENTLIPDTAEQHIARLEQAGFSQISQVFQCLNFTAWIATK